MAEVIALLLAALTMAATLVMLHPQVQYEEPIQLPEGFHTKSHSMDRPLWISQETEHRCCCQAAGLALGAAVLGAVLCGSLAGCWTHLMESTPLCRKLQARFSAISGDPPPPPPRGGGSGF